MAPSFFLFAISTFFVSCSFGLICCVCISLSFGDLTWKNFNPRDVLQEFLNDPFARFLAGSELEFYSSLITQVIPEVGIFVEWTKAQRNKAQKF